MLKLMSNPVIQYFLIKQINKHEKKRKDHNLINIDSEIQNVYSAESVYFNLKEKERQKSKKH